MEDDGPFPRGVRCDAIAASFDDTMRGWVCATHVRTNACLRSLMPSDVAELALMLANADLDDDALDTILGNGLDEHATRLEAFLSARAPTHRER